MTPSFVSFNRFCLLALAWPSLALAQTSVSVNAGTTVRIVDERVFGVNTVIWDPQAGSTQTVSLLKAADLRAIRVPGGSLSDEYHWRTNTNLGNTSTWATGFNGFTNLITGLNAQAMVTVNYGTGTPEEAAAWVAYANAASSASTVIGNDSKGYNWQTAGTWAALRGASPLASDDGMNFLRIGRTAAIGVKYWEIGNENYGSWESDEQAAKNDPTTYANRASDYIAKMKAVDPSIKVGVVVVTGSQYNGWTRVMLTRLRDLGVTPDFVIDHRYEQAPAADQPGNPESDAGLLQKAQTWPAEAADLRQQVNSYLGATAGAGVEILVTENNSVYGSPGKQTTSLVNGLYYADSVGNLLQTEINSLMWWDLRNGQDKANNNSSGLYGWRGYGDYGILSTPSSGGSSTYYDPYPTYYVMKLLAKFARKLDTVVAATSNNNLLSVFAVKSIDGSLNLLVINKDPSVTRDASIALAGFTPAASASVYAYGKAQDTAAQTGTGSADITSGTMAVSGATFSASFAPYSVTVLSLTAGTAAPITPAPVTPTPMPSSSSGGGGGGAPSLWFAGGLALLGMMRRSVRR